MKVVVSSTISLTSSSSKVYSISSYQKREKNIVRLFIAKKEKEAKDYGLFAIDGVDSKQNIQVLSIGSSDEAETRTTKSHLTLKPNDRDVEKVRGVSD